MDQCEIIVCACACGCFRRGKELMPRREDGSICYSDTHYRDTWAAMESLVDKGLVKAIGVSNFNARQTDDIISMARHLPVVNQVQCGQINTAYEVLLRIVIQCVSRGPTGRMPSISVSSRPPVSLSVSAHLQINFFVKFKFN